MTRRAYRDESDILLLRAFNSRAIEATGGCGYLHPGDITHHFFSGNKLFDHSALATIWEDASGVAAWMLAGPRHRSFDAQVRPDLRGGELEREVLVHAEERTREMMRRHGIEADRIEADAFQCDSNRSRMLLDLGWIAGTRAGYVRNRRSLREIPEPVIPEGYGIRPVRGLEEAAAVAALHVAVFSRSGWTEELYRVYMQSPGYDPAHEFVAEASEGSLAGFTVTWFDDRTRTGLFEPVGTHPDHRRKGLGRALLYTVMRQMADAGLQHAIVDNEADNPGSRDLYRSCGFEPWQIEDGFFKSFA